VNYDEFSRNLTNEEQEQLLKYLPVVDTAKFPDRLESVHFYLIKILLIFIIEHSFDFVL